MEIGLPGPAFSASWFLGLLIVAVVGGLAAAVGGLIVRGMDRGAQVEADQTAMIQAVREELHQCQLRESERLSCFVTREQHEGRIMRIEDSIDALKHEIDKRLDKLGSRIHARLDVISLKLGIGEE
jgi:hypothetical protein